MLDAILVSVFVAAVLVVAAYAMFRPMTHVHYRHTNEKLWRPLD
jgi:hypothetical protein